MRNLFPFFLVLLVVLSACATAQDAGAPDAASLPDYLQAQVDSAQAGGSAQVYATQAALYQATVTLATAYAVATSDVRKTAQAQDTRVAVSKTEQASASATADHKAAVAKTEDANARATMDAKTAIAKTEEAHARSTDIALRHEASTAQANASETAQAHVNATATWVAGAPTRILIAQIQANEDAARQAAQAENEARVAMNLQLAPYRAAWDMFAGPVFLSVLVLVLLAGLWLVLRAGARYLSARSLERENGALQKRLITDVNGRPLGFIQERKNGTYMITPVMLQTPALPEPETPVSPAVPMRDMVDRQTIEQTAAPDPQVLNGFIHYTSLRAFIAAILESGDWTQARWADVTLPRGYVLSKDTKDERGNVVYGGYARVMELLTQKNLIVGRKRGAAGQWNPHAPRDAESVMDILYNKQPAPALPDKTREANPSPAKMLAA